MSTSQEIDEFLRQLREPAVAATYRSQLERLLHDVAQAQPEPVLDEASAPLLAERVPDLPFLTEIDKDAPWRMVLQSRLTGNPLRMLFRFASDFLMGLQYPPLAAAAYRDGELPDAQGEQVQPLLAQTVEIDTEQFLVEVYATRQLATPDELHLHVVLAGAQPLPPGVEVCLTWASVVRSAILGADGSADLGTVSLASVEDAQANEAFEIAFVIH